MGGWGGDCVEEVGSGCGGGTPDGVEVGAVGIDRGNGDRDLAEDGTGIELGIHAMDGQGTLAGSVGDEPEDRIGSAVLGERAGVEIPETGGGELEDRGGDAMGEGKDEDGMEVVLGDPIGELVLP